MKELKFAEPKEIMIEELGETILIKSYLLVEEINEIVNICKDENPITRDLIMCSLIIDKCTNLDELVKIENEDISVNMELYNLYKVNGIIDKIFSEIDDKYITEIEYYISQFNSVNASMREISNTVSKCLESANKAIDKATKGDMNKIVENLVAKVKELLEKR